MSGLKNCKLVRIKWTIFNLLRLRKNTCQLYDWEGRGGRGRFEALSLSIHLPCFLCLISSFLLGEQVRRKYPPILRKVLPCLLLSHCRWSLTLPPPRLSLSRQGGNTLRMFAVVFPSCWCHAGVTVPVLRLGFGIITRSESEEGVWAHGWRVSYLKTK